MTQFESHLIPWGVQKKYVETPLLTIKSIRKLREDEYKMTNYDVNAPYEVEVEEDVIYENGTSKLIWFFACADNDNSYPPNCNLNAPIIYYFLDNLNKQVKIPLWNKYRGQGTIGTIYSIRGMPVVLQIIEKAKQNSIIAEKKMLFTENLQVKPSLERFIARGGYGEVYYGKWNLQEVAVKKLYLSLPNTSESDIKSIQKEVNMLKNLRNRYIIQYYGIHYSGREFLIVMDYAENGTLTKFVNDNKDKEHDWDLNIKIIKQITLGLVYIHSENVIHRDLKSMNILLTNGYQVKISDFGLAKTKIVSSSQSTHSMTGTLRWMAPELFKGQKHSEHSDIYALGMIIWEIVAKCTTPFKDIDNNLVMYKIAFNNEKETIPNDTPESIRDIIRQCWKDNPQKRTTLVNILDTIGEDEDKYLLEDIQSSQDWSLVSVAKNEQQVYSSNRDLDLDINLEELNILEDPQEQSSTQAQIQIPPK